MNFVALLALIRKNLKLVLRSRLSAIIVIFGPLLLILLLSISFNSATIYGVRVGVFSEEFSPLSTSLVDGLQEQRMAVSHTENEEDCINGLRLGIYNVCAVFPPRYSIENGGEVIFHVDPSRYNLVHFVGEELNKQVSEKSDEISSQLTQDVVDVLDDVRVKIDDRKQLLSQIGSDVQAVDGILDSVSSQLLSFDLDPAYGSFRFSILDAEIDELKTAAGIETGASDTLDSLQADVDRLIEQLYSYDTLRSGVFNNIDDTKALLEADVSIVAHLQDTLNGILRDIQKIESQDVGTIVSPIDTRIEPLLGGSDERGLNINYLFPTLVVILLMFSGMLLAATLEVREKSDKVHFKNFLTPTNQLSFTLGNFFANFFVVVAQAAFLFIAGLFFFAHSLVGMWVDISIIVLLVAATFVFMGMLVGILFRHEETALIVSIALGFILLFFSGAIVPVEILPKMLEWVYIYNPFAIGEFLLNKTILFQTGITIAEMMSRVFILIGWVIGLFVISLFSRHTMARRS